MKRFKFLFTLFLAFIAFFVLGKLCFMLYNADIEPFTLTNFFDVLWHGLPMDVSVVCSILLLPWFVCTLSVWNPNMRIRHSLRWYLCGAVIVAVACVVTDCAMYAFWKFKLHAVLFSYMQASEASNSTSAWFLISRFGTAFLLMGLLGGWLVKATPRHFAIKNYGMPNVVHRGRRTLGMLLLGGLILLGARGGVGFGPMHMGRAYYSPVLFLNHAAVNPVFSLFASINCTDRYGENFNYLGEEERAFLFDGLFPEDTEDVQDTLLRVGRPNVLVVLMESFGATFVEELGGVPGVAPNLSRLIPEGIFWDNYYSNSFRTDRGTVSAFSGWVSYPTVSLMRQPSLLSTVPGLASTLAAEGYDTHYIYSGDMEVMDKKDYLVHCGYETLTSGKDYTAEEVHSSKWGVTDSLSAMRCYQIIRQQPTGRPWHIGYQTLSSHEPWEVPYHRLEDPVLNAFAYTDQCIGQLIDSLKTLPQWDNMLVILIPDHGITYRLTYQNPEFFHSPMLWLGGAIREPRRMHTLMGQNDLAATLLSQMGISHKNYVWSRNVLSRNYTHPCVYCTFPSGIMLRDQTGATIFDITSDRVIADQPSPDMQRLNRAKAILQTSYDLLDTM